MAAHKIGPWSSDEWKEFVALDTDLRATRSELNSLSALYGLGELAQERLHQQRADLIAAAWKARHSHPVYKTLAAEPNFRQAWKVFEARRKTDARGNLAADNAPFIFLREIVECAGFTYQFRDAPDVTRGGHAKRRRAAVKHVDALTALLASGIHLKDYVDNDGLRALLKKFGDELRSTRRKDYGGKRYISRWVLKGLASMLVIRLDLRSPAIICHFARMVGIACETKTAQRYCSEAAKTWRDRLAVAEMARAERTAQATAPPGQKSSLM